MTMIREDLNRRLEALKLTLGEDELHLRMEAPNSMIFGRAKRNVEELRAIEATLATMQLADAQRDLAAAQEKVAGAQVAANKHAEAEKSRAEEVNFWLRRLLTTTAIANAVGFVSVVAFMTKSDSPLIAPKDVGQALSAFFGGTLVGGAFPVVRIFQLWADSLADRGEGKGIRFDWIYAAAAIGLFLYGLLLVIGCARGYYSARA